MSYDKIILKIAQKLKKMQNEGINSGEKIHQEINESLMENLKISKNECGDINSGPFADVLYAWISLK